MSKKEDLITILIESGYDDLVSDFKKIKTKVEPLLARITETFPEFTEHNIKHSERVLKNLNWLIPTTIKKAFNEHEIYFLATSAYLHDIGMIDFPELINDRMSFDSDEELKSYIRAFHHTRTEEFIINHYKDLGIDDEHQASIIGRICRGHRQEDLHNRELFKPDEMYKNNSINMPFLSALLRLADEFDITFERTPKITYDHIPVRDTISKNEWAQHLAISGVALSPDDSLLIKCTARCNNPKIHRCLKNFESKINRNLDDLSSYLHQMRDYRKDLPIKFIIEIEAQGYKFYDFKFSLQEKHIIELLMGEKLYSRKEESLRELIKNCVDSCRLKKELLNKKGIDFNPEIMIENIPEDKTIKINDNGMGMDKDIVERYFTKIGESFYNSPEFYEQRLSFTPVGELGIGILSCFMIANRIIVDTKAENDIPLQIEIDNISDYFFVKEGKKTELGTTVTLFLKENLVDSLDLEKEIRLCARHLDIPIVVKNSSADDCVIKDIGYKPNINIFGSDRRYGFHNFKFKDNEVEGIISIPMLKDDIVGLRPIRLYYPDVKEIKYEELNFITYEGILIGHIDKFLPEWNKYTYHDHNTQMFIDINIKDNIIDLNAARNDIVENDKYVKFRQKIEIIIFKAFTSYIRKIRRKTKSSGLLPNVYINSLIDTHIHHYTIKELIKHSKLSDAFIDFIKKNYYHKCLYKNKILNLNYNEILKYRRPDYGLIHLNNYNTNEILHLYQNCTGFSKEKLYLVLDYYYDAMSDVIFSVDKINFLKIIDYIISDDLKGIILKTWKLADFHNYKTSRLIAFSDYDSTIINKNNKFIDLLIRGKHLLKGRNKVAIEGFFRALKYDLKKDIQILVNKQIAILQIFSDAGIIQESEIHDYIIHITDFPSSVYET